MVVCCCKHAARTLSPFIRRTRSTPSLPPLHRPHPHYSPHRHRRHPAAINTRPCKVKLLALGTGVGVGNGDAGYRVTIVSPLLAIQETALISSLIGFVNPPTTITSAFAGLSHLPQRQVLVKGPPPLPSLTFLNVVPKRRHQLEPPLELRHPPLPRWEIALYDRREAVTRRANGRDGEGERR